MRGEESILGFQLFRQREGKEEEKKSRFGTLVFVSMKFMFGTLVFVIFMFRTLVFVSMELYGTYTYGILVWKLSQAILVYGLLGN